MQTTMTYSICMSRVRTQWRSWQRQGSLLRSDRAGQHHCCAPGYPQRGPHQEQSLQYDSQRRRYLPELHPMWRFICLKRLARVWGRQRPPRPLIPWSTQVGWFTWVTWAAAMDPWITSSFRRAETWRLRAKMHFTVVESLAVQCQSRHLRPRHQDYFHYCSSQWAAVRDSSAHWLLQVS